MKMAELNITYSHNKEIYIVNKYVDAFEKFGAEIPNVEKSADKEKTGQTVRRLRKLWTPKEDKFIERLNWFYDCDFEINGWSAYLIRSRICPYSPEEKFFAVSLDKSTKKQLNTIGHELFHQPFHLYWEDKCLEKLKDEQLVHNLKEALAELLNTPEFNISKEIDIGWDNPGEQQIRNLIKEYYQENGAFTFQEFWEEMSSLENFLI